MTACLRLSVVLLLQDTLTTTLREGFDHRVSNLHWTLGAGNYFAQSASYSDAYRWVGGWAGGRQHQARLHPVNAMRSGDGNCRSGLADCRAAPVHMFTAAACPSILLLRLREHMAAMLAA